jgi:hypothetical protein
MIPSSQVDGEENNVGLSVKQKNDANKRTSHDRGEAQIFKLQFRPQLVIPSLLTQLLGFLLQDSWALGLFQPKKKRTYKITPKMAMEKQHHFHVDFSTIQAPSKGPRAGASKCAKV